PHALCQNPRAHDICHGGRKHDVHRAQADCVYEPRTTDENKAGNGHRHRSNRERDESDSFSGDEEVGRGSRSTRRPDADPEDYCEIKNADSHHSWASSIWQRDLEERAHATVLSHPRSWSSI